MRSARLVLAPRFLARAVFLVGRVQAGQGGAFVHLAHDPVLQVFLLSRRRGDIIEQRSRDQHGAVLVHHDDVVGEDGDAAAIDGLLPAYEGEARDRRRR